jgi:pantoate--beta-alanine ligase
MPMMEIAKSLDELRSIRKTMDGRIGLVATMGALHEGHLSLVRRARTDNDIVIATIFINPTQFSPDEDLDAYPRDLDGDLAKFEATDVNLVFTPTPNMMYPGGYQTYINVENVTQKLEGIKRPAHFRGVTTIVAKLFNLTQPDVAYFGQKDAQQVVVIRRMAYDLNFPLEIVVCPTARERDGLAMSSRNAYLTPDERQHANVLYYALKSAGDAYDQGERNILQLEETIIDLLSREPRINIQYVSIMNARTLNENSLAEDEPLLASGAITLGKTRLIDNILLPQSLNNFNGLNQILGVVE